MTQDRDTPIRVVLVSACVAVGCAVMVTAAVSYFRPMQAAHASLDRSRHILMAAGLLANKDELSALQVATRFRQLTVRAVDLRTGNLTDAVDPLTFDFDTAAASDSGSTALPKARDPARLGRRPNLMPIYFLRNNGALASIVLPVYGQGMWSTIRGFISLQADAKTVQSMVIEEHGETPGIGDRIEDVTWLGSWSGKQVLDQNGAVALRLVGPSKAATDPNAVDAITGATVTSESVVALVQFWLGDDGYGPVLRQLQRDAG
jgi:Na+-transporting NADH:ubiquinone oxidoreductase subunit C